MQINPRILETAALAAHAINELVNALSDIHYWTREVGPANVDQVFAYPLLKRGILSR